MYRSIYWILAASALVAAAGCGEDTGKAAKKTPTNTTLELPYTPEGCDYTVSAPEGIEEVGGDEDVVGAEPTPKHLRDAPGDVMPARLWDVEHLELDLVLDIEAGRIEGSATPSQLLPEGSIVM